MIQCYTSSNVKIKKEHALRLKSKIDQHNKSVDIKTYSSKKLNTTQIEWNGIEEVYHVPVVR